MTTTVPRWVKLLALLVPGDIRRDFVANVAAEHGEMREREASRLSVVSFYVRSFLTGFAQHAPLNPSASGSGRKLHVAERASLIGWIAWRVSGAALFFGWLTATWPLLVGGALALLTAYGCLVAVAVTGKDPLPEKQARFLTGLLGGTVTALLLMVLCGALTIGLLALGELVSSGLVLGFAVHVLVFVAVTIAFAVTGSGWVPQEWTPKLLVENDDVVHRHEKPVSPSAPSPV